MSPEEAVKFFEEHCTLDTTLVTPLEAILLDVPAGSYKDPRTRQVWEKFSTSDGPPYKVSIDSHTEGETIKWKVRLDHE